MTDIAATIARLRDLLSKATPGREWKATNVEDEFNVTGRWYVMCAPGDGTLQRIASLQSFFKPAADAALIAESRNALGSLLDELDRVLNAKATAE